LPVYLAVQWEASTAGIAPTEFTWSSNWLTWQSDNLNSRYRVYILRYGQTDPEFFGGSTWVGFIFSGSSALPADAVEIRIVAIGAGGTVTGGVLTINNARSAPSIITIINQTPPPSNFRIWSNQVEWNASGQSNVYYRLEGQSEYNRLATRVWSVQFSSIPPNAVSLKVITSGNGSLSLSGTTFNRATGYSAPALLPIQRTVISTAQPQDLIVSGESLNWQASYITRIYYRAAGQSAYNFIISRWAWFPFSELPTNAVGLKLIVVGDLTATVTSGTLNLTSSVSVPLSINLTRQDSNTLPPVSGFSLDFNNNLRWTPVVNVRVEHRTQAGGEYISSGWWNWLPLGSLPVDTISIRLTRPEQIYASLNGNTLTITRLTSPPVYLYIQDILEGRF